MSNLQMTDNSGRLCTNFIIRVWFMCLMKNRANFSRLWQYYFMMSLQSGPINVVRKQNVLLKKISL